MIEEQYSNQQFGSNQNKLHLYAINEILVKQRVCIATLDLLETPFAQKHKTGMLIKLQRLSINSLSIKYACLRQIVKSARGKSSIYNNVFKYLQKCMPGTSRKTRFFKYNLVKLNADQQIDISRIFIIIFMSKTTSPLLYLLAVAILIQSVISQNKQIRLHNDQPNLTDKEIMQQALNGIFRQNNLPEPTTIVVCFDDVTASKVVYFTGQNLNKTAKGSVFDILNSYNASREFAKQLPDPVKQCLSGNAQFESLGLKYGIDNQTSPDQIEKKVIQYIALHYFDFHKWALSVNDKWNAAKYYQAAFEAAGHANTILPITKSPFVGQKIDHNSLNSFQRLPDYQQLMAKWRLMHWRNML